MERPATKPRLKAPLPLSDSQSEETVESHPTPKPHRRRGPKKKTLEELKELVAKLTTEGENLKTEAEELKKFYESLKSLILLFKSYKSHRVGLEDVAVHGSTACNNSDSVQETETRTAPHPSESIALTHISKPETPANSEQP